MSKTSSEVKRRYNEKTYSRFICDLKKADFERIELLRGEKSRAQFLLMLVEQYESEMEEGKA